MKHSANKHIKKGEGLLGSVPTTTDLCLFPQKQLQDEITATISVMYTKKQRQSAGISGCIWTSICLHPSEREESMREQKYFWSPYTELLLQRKLGSQSQTKIHLKDYPEGCKRCLNSKCWLLTTMGCIWWALGSSHPQWGIRSSTGPEPRGKKFRIGASLAGF